MILLISTNGIDHLSDKEIEVMRLAALGLSNKEIANKLGISLYSAEKRFELILSKLNITGRTGTRVKLTHLALQINLVPNLYLHLNGKKR